MSYHHQRRIEYPCLACGNTTLMIDQQGWLICSWLPCKEPDAMHNAVKSAIIDRKLNDSLRKP